MVLFPPNLAVEVPREAAAAGVFSSNGSSWSCSWLLLISLFVPPPDHQCRRVTGTCRGWQLGWDVGSSADEPFSSTLATLMAFFWPCFFLPKAALGWLSPRGAEQCCGRVVLQQERRADEAESPRLHIHDCFCCTPACDCPPSSSCAFTMTLEPSPV